MIVYLKKNIKSRILNGHPWVYANEIESIPEEPEPGSIVTVLLGKQFVGKGYYNPHSLITVRILSRKDEEIDQLFFKKRIERALKVRKDIFAGEASYRMVYGEGDGLPGLIVDKFSDYLVMQITSLGMDKWREAIVNILIELIQPKGIREKDDEKSAKKEGFVPREAWIYRDGPELIPFKMHGLVFLSDTRGQKTGFFLDQRLNAQNLVKYSEHKVVLDGFAYTGNFGIHALKGKASFVVFTDYSQRALAVLEEVLALNNIDKSRYELIHTNTFEYLRALTAEGKCFDITIIDPPSLAKSRDSRQSAVKGYRELNLRAMKITKNGGLLATSSCTQIVYEEDFKKVLYDAADNTRKRLAIVYKGMQSPDHPVVLNILETEYLKHYLVRVENIKDY